MPHQKIALAAPQKGGKTKTITTLNQLSSSTTLPPLASNPSSPASEKSTTGQSTAAVARSARNLTSSAVDDQPPSPTSSTAMHSAVLPAPSTRKRSRALIETLQDATVEEEGHSKGGHSLRKRARIDYTQEVIDDEVGVAITKTAAATPTTRSRKRRGAADDSEEESDREEFSSANKRRRAERSPAPMGRTAGSYRRRQPSASKKPATEVAPALATSVVGQLADDVQDTILVGVPMDDTGAESTQSSPQKTDSRSDSSIRSADKDAGRTKETSPAPQQELDASWGTSAASSATLASNSPVDETKVTQEQRLTIEPPAAAAAAKDSPRPSEPKASPSPSAESAPRPTTENAAASGQPAPEAKPSEGSAAAPAAQAEVSSPLLRRAAKSTGPARMRALEPIYSSPTPFGTLLKLTPYESEDIALPGPFTEWVYPAADKAKAVEPIPVVTPTAASVSTEPKPVVSWDARRPLKVSEFFNLWRQEKKRREEAGEPPISLVEFNNVCAKRYREAQKNLDQPGRISPADEEEEVPAPKKSATKRKDVEESVQDDSQAPTAAPSPAAAEDEANQEDAVDEEQDTAIVSNSPALKPDSPVEPIEVTRLPRKQYLFPKLRDPNEFVEALENYQEMDSDKLYSTLAAAVETMDVYQREYNELRKILDDEDNAKRRQANDKTIVNWENRQKADDPPHWRRHFDDVVKGPTPYEIRGVRAPKPYVDDPVLEHQREEDRLMAQIYGFKHNNHPSMVGRQNPEEQRWEMPENRLRKRTEKGAELAEDNVIEGKRTRKPRYVNESKDVSRAGTPLPSLPWGRRQRRKRIATPLDGEGEEADAPAENVEQPVRKGRRGRPPASAVAAATAAAQAQADRDDQESVMAEAQDANQTEDENEVETKPKGRRRGRIAAAKQEAPTSVPAGFGKRGRGANAGQETLYGQAVEQQQESRPSTASSEHTNDTVESTYSLREKKRRNFALENDPEIEPRRRGRGTVKQDTNSENNGEPRRRQRRKEPAAQDQPEVPMHPQHQQLAQTAAQSAPGSPHLQPIAASKFYHSFMTGPMVVEHMPQQAAHQPAQGPYLHTFNASPAFPPGVTPPPPPPPSVKKPITKIKITNPPGQTGNGTSNGSASASGSTSRAQTPANGTGGKGKGRKSSAAASTGEKNGSGASASAGSGVVNGDFDKPYAEMTKSEKMSWSMRRKFPLYSYIDLVTTILTLNRSVGLGRNARRRREASHYPGEQEGRACSR